MVNIKKGFTLIEILIVLGIIAVLAVISFVAFAGLQKNRILDKEASVILSILEEARSLTLSSKEASRYGVYFEVSGREVVLFRGSTYDPESINNRSYFLDNAVVISEVNLVGGDDSFVVFSRLSGAVEQHGTIIISLTADSEKSATIAVYPTGVVEKLQ